MLRQGPIPRFVHGIVEYLGGAAFIVAPFVLAFESDPATAVSIVTGVLLIVLAATTEGRTSLIDQIPLAVHVVLDYLLAALLIAAPFLFRFSDEDDPTAFFIAAGVLYLLIAIGTRFVREERPRRRERMAGRREAG